jgi:hypothetical protein
MNPNYEKALKRQLVSQSGASVIKGITFQNRLPIAVRLQWINTQGGLVNYANVMRVRTGSNGWLLVGDFNCSSDRMIQYITSQKINYGPMTTCYPTTFHTHDSGKTLDYILASSDEVLHNLPPIAPLGAIVVPNPVGQAIPGENWLMGEAKSDHKLICYTQDNGPTVRAVHTVVL